ncbi:MAG: DUF2304 domain-containing protein [Chloroflexota bacterium]
MIDRAMIFGVISAVGTLAFVIELVRRRKLREEYSLLWLGTALVLLLLATSRPMLDAIAGLIGIFYPPSALFLVAIVFMLLILLHFSTVLTRLTQENKEIAQEMALLRQELTETRARLHQEQDA